MSGAHVTFRGLKPPQLKGMYPCAYQGDPCLHAKHNTPDGKAQCWRDGLTHACLACLEDIANTEFALDIKRLTKSVQRKALKFWSKVEIGNHDECWRWTDKLVKQQLYFIWPRKSIRNNWGFHPTQVSIWLSWGDVARSGTISLCNERRCVNPLHNLPIEIYESMDLNSLSSDYLDDQVSLLKSQVADYHEMIRQEDEHKAARKKNGGSDIFDPTLSPEAKQDILRIGGTTPFQIKFIELQQSLLDKSHSMFSKPATD